MPKHKQSVSLMLHNTKYITRVPTVKENMLFVSTSCREKKFDSECTCFW